MSEGYARSVAPCPEDPMGPEGMRHRALDDAVMEGWVLRALVA